MRRTNDQRTRLLSGIRTFFKSIGLVEQAQIVASTGVVVAMVTIVISRVVTRQPLGPLDFISVLTIGVFGYVIVYFSLKYARMLEAQRRELLELNEVAESVNRSVELEYVLESALERVMELMHADSGWIYLEEGGMLVLKQQSGTIAPFFRTDCPVDGEALGWIREPALLAAEDRVVAESTTSEFREEGVKLLVSIPLVRRGIFAGVLIIGGKDPKQFEARKIEVIQAFGNQISAALNNAWLYDQVRRSERQYADLYENLPDMYHSIDRNGVVVVCNTTESRMLGRPKAEIIGKSVMELYPPAQRGHVAGSLRKIFELGRELRGVEEQIRRADGTLIDVSVNTSLICDAEGRPAIARMVLRDITEKKKMEQKIFEAQRIDSLGNMAGGIAHDFNNILTAILGSASIMHRRMKDDPRWSKYVELIETTSRRGAGITRQLTIFARKTAPRLDRVDVNAVIEQTLRLFEVGASRLIHVKFVPSPEPVIVEGDDAQLQQAIFNLCLNARDAMPDEGILIIECTPVDLDEAAAADLVDGSPGPYVRITVADSGVGIPPEAMPHIFEPFFTTKEPGKGTGLGLAVVYRVVKNHRGSIDVKSELDSGTVFTIHLPRLAGAGPVGPGRPGTEELVGGSERILLIEDEISVGEVGGDILRELGYTVVTARNGREAMEMLDAGAQRFDLVILDMNMPRLAGRATFDGIKSRFPGIRVLVCSGHSATMIDDGKFVHSIDGFLQKPYELGEIARMVRSVLDAPARPSRPL